MESNLKQKTEELDASSIAFSKSVQENKEISEKMKYLEETLKLQIEQNARNGELVRKLQDNSNVFREKFDDEKQKNIDLFEENQSLQKLNTDLQSHVENLQDRLSDTSEKKAWLAKIHEIREFSESRNRLEV